MHDLLLRRPASRRLVRSSPDAGRGHPRWRTTWQRSSLPGDVTPTTGIDCVDADTCFAGGQDPSGNTRSSQPTTAGRAGPAADVASAPVAVPVRRYLVRDDDVVRGRRDLRRLRRRSSSAVITTNGGRSWTTSDFPAAFVPSKVRCVTGGTCLTVGYEGQASAVGAILYSTDGGSTWSTTTVPAGVRPISRHLVQQRRFELSRRGLLTTPASPLASSVLTSTDGGRTWAEAARRRAAIFHLDLVVVRHELVLLDVRTGGRCTYRSRPRQPLLA